MTDEAGERMFSAGEREFWYLRPQDGEMESCLLVALGFLIPTQYSVTLVCELVGKRKVS